MDLRLRLSPLKDKSCRLSDLGRRPSSSSLSVKKNKSHHGELSGNSPGNFSVSVGRSGSVRPFLLLHPKSTAEREEISPAGGSIDVTRQNRTEQASPSLCCVALRYTHGWWQVRTRQEGRD
jgi:hypothetical protein